MSDRMRSARGTVASQCRRHDSLCYLSFDRTTAIRMFDLRRAIVCDLGPRHITRSRHVLLVLSYPSGFVFGLFLPRRCKPPEFDNNDLERSSHGDGEKHGDEATKQAAEPTSDICAHQDRHEHNEWVDLDRLRHNNRV